MNEVIKLAALENAAVTKSWGNDWAKEYEAFTADQRDDVDGMWEIVRVVSQLTEVTVSDLFGPSRQRKIARARQFAMFKMNEAGNSASAIARFFERDHTTVGYAIKAVSERAIQ